MKKNRENTLIKLVSFLVGPLLMIGLVIVYCNKKTGFNLSKIRSKGDFYMKVGDEPSAEDLAKFRSVFSQEFTYLGSGVQCYVFDSKDQEYVLKFFKMKHSSRV